MEASLRHVCTGHSAALYALCPAPSPGLFLSAGGDGWITAWDYADPDVGRVIAQAPSKIFALQTLTGGDNPVLIAGNMDGGLHQIFPGSPERTRNIQHHRKGVFALCADGEWVWSAGGEGVLTRWRAEPFQSMESVHLSHVSLRCIALDPHRRRMAVGASDSHIYVLDTDTLALLHTVRGAHVPSVFALRWDPIRPDRLLSGGRDAILREWHIGPDDVRMLSEHPAHWYTVNDLAWSPDGQLLATASRDKTVKIWDSAHLRLLKVLDAQRHGGHVNSVNRLLWSPQALLSCGDDRTVMIWDVRS